MNPVNERAPAMWEIVRPHVEWKGAEVIDFGFGGGDMLLYAARAGASKCGGFDRERNNFVMLREKAKEYPEIYWNIAQRDMEEHIAKHGMFLFGDVAFCFSVLPYLADPHLFLLQLRLHEYSPVFIECQYAGDGPGFEHIRDDADMAEWLEQVGWENPVPIGKTHVAGRDKYRTIWKCEAR